MKTLYDLLGALPHDNAGALRAAFRRAVKAAHPDLRPDDPYAALKFRQIVCASEILGDAEQRAAYDHLLELARQEQDSASGHAIAARLHKLASGAIALAGVSVVTIGGYLLFMHMSAASFTPANNVGLPMRTSPEIAAVNPKALHDMPDWSVPPAKHDSPAPATNATGSPARDIFAAHDHDPDGPLGGPYQAVQFYPTLPAYLDRGTLFYRQRKFDGTFADITRVKRTEKPSRFKSAARAVRKPRFNRLAITASVTPLFRRQTAAQDPSREEGVAPLRER